MRLKLCLKLGLRFHSDVVEKKRRLVVEVESLASSWKKLRHVDVKAYVVEKNEESQRTFNKNSCDLLTAITHTEILCALCKTNKQFNWKKKL